MHKCFGSQGVKLGFLLKIIHDSLCSKLNESHDQLVNFNGISMTMGFTISTYDAYYYVRLIKLE